MKKDILVPPYTSFFRFKYPEMFRTMLKNKKKKKKLFFFKIKSPYRHRNNNSETVEQLIKISQDPIPSEEHSLSHTAVLSEANLSLLMSQLPPVSSYPHSEIIVAEDTAPSCRGRNKEQSPRERRPQLYPNSCKVSFKSAGAAFLLPENKRAFRSSRHPTASFPNVKKQSGLKKASFPAVIQDLLRGE